jgi:hypothetical protein
MNKVSWHLYQLLQFKHSRHLQTLNCFSWDRNPHPFCSKTTMTSLPQFQQWANRNCGRQKKSKKLECKRYSAWTLTSW